MRRIEKGEGTTYESLRLLAAAHGMEIGDYLHEVARFLDGVDKALDFGVRSIVQTGNVEP